MKSRAFYLATLVFAGSIFGAKADDLPTLHLMCENGTTIVFRETRTPKGLGIAGNQIEIVERQISKKTGVKVTNTHSGLRIVEARIEQTHYLLQELADAPYWVLAQASSGVSAPAVRCIRN